MKLSKQEKIDLYAIRETLSEIAQIYNDINEYDLCGACGISAYLTYYYFKERNPKFVVGDCHCYIVIEDEILDLTATQFGEEYPSIFIEKIDNLDRYDESFLLNTKWYSSPGKAKKRFSTWEGQNPFNILEQFKDRLS